MRKLGSTWLPFLKGDSTEQNMNGVTERMNEMISEHDLHVVNVETVYATNWLGRPVEPCGMRVWWLAESQLSAQELVQPLFDRINT
ncbi:hypothetical protein [Pseudomonas fragariae (ex Marin et al. 2024)]|uniref:hypothetical protein n=1 Tax=Pseudomonas fragariae (ex Marin et al. 2024) TaxID=3080056 RepID=UPI002A240D3E|nr:hypothetical protein [Pseudomonas sp. 20]MDX9625914.1 hypothetical protein [Pseudomonas sp. 20]